MNTKNNVPTALPSTGIRLLRDLLLAIQGTTTTTTYKAVGETPYLGRVGVGRAWAFIYVPGYWGGPGSAFDIGGIGGRSAAETSSSGG
jgi:hypothetical protein